MAIHEHTARVPTRHYKPDWSFYAAWILLTVLCFPIAFFFDNVILRIIITFVGDYIYVDGVRRITEDYLGVFVFIPIIGLLTGLAQYWLLQRYLPRIGWWVLATIAGWLLGYLLIAIPGRMGWTDAFQKNIDLMFLVMGSSIGLAQWLLLRLRLSRAGWWIAANVLGWGLLSLVTPGESIGQFGLLVVGFLPACTTAAVLAWMLKEVPESVGQAV